jgi:hypothetical protein
MRRFQSLNVCLDVWSNRGVSEEPKIAETCGANEIRIDVGRCIVRVADGFRCRLGATIYAARRLRP